MSFTFAPHPPRSPILELDPHELATAVRGTIGTTVPDIADLASDFVLHFNMSGRQFMELGENILNTLSNNDPIALERLSALRTFPPESLNSLLSSNSRSPSISNSSQELAPIIGHVRAERSSEAIFENHHIAEISGQEEINEPFEYGDEDNSISDELPMDNDGLAQERDVESAPTGHELALRNPQPLLLTDQADEEIVTMGAISQVDTQYSSPTQLLEEHAPVSTEVIHYLTEPMVSLSTRNPISGNAEEIHASFQDRNSTETNTTCTDNLIVSNTTSGSRKPNQDEETVVKLAVVAENEAVNGNILLGTDCTNSSKSQTLPSGVYPFEESSHLKHRSLQLFDSILSESPEDLNHVGNPSQQDMGTDEPQHENIILPSTVAHKTEFTATLNMPQDISVTSTESAILRLVPDSSIIPESELNMIRHPSSSFAMPISTTSSISRIIVAGQVPINNASHGCSPFSQISSDLRLTERSTSSVEPGVPLLVPKGNEDIPDQNNDILGPSSPLLVDYSFEHLNVHDQPLDDVATSTPSVSLVLEGAGSRTDLHEDDGADFAFLMTPSSSDAQEQPIAPAAPQTLLDLHHGSANSATRIVGDSNTFSASMLIFIEQTLSSNLRNPVEPSTCGGSSSLANPFSAHTVEDSSHTEINSPSCHRDLSSLSPSSISNSNVDDQPADHLNLPILDPDPPNASTDPTMKMMMPMYASTRPSRHKVRTEFPSSPTFSTLAQRSEGSPPEISSPAAADGIPVLRIAIVSDPIKSGTEVKPSSPPSLLSDTVLVSDIANSPTLAVSISDGSSVLHLQPSYAAPPSLELYHIPSTKPCNLGSWTNTSRQSFLAYVEGGPLTASCSLSNTAPCHAAEQDNSVLPESPSRTVIIHSEDQFMMTPDILPGIPLPNDLNLLDNYGIASSASQPTPRGLSTGYNSVLLPLVDSGCPMASHDRRLAGTDVKNTPIIAVELSPRLPSENGANMGSFSQRPFSVKEANFEVGSVAGFRPVIDIDLLGSERRFNIDIDSRSDSSGRPGVQEYNATDLSSEKHEFSLPIIPLDRSFSQEIASALEFLSFDHPANPCHIVAETSHMATLLTSPRKPSRDTPRTLWPVSEYLYDEGRTSVALPDDDKPAGKRKTRWPLSASASHSKARGADLVVPTYRDIAIQTDLDCQRQLSRIQTRDQDRIDPVGPSPLSALLLPSRDIVLGAVQKVFATVLPKDTSKDSTAIVSYPTSCGRPPRVEVTSVGLLPTFHGPLSAISRDGEL